MKLLDHILPLCHSPIYNYVLPGVTSHIVAGKGDKDIGCIRLLHSQRETFELVIPHNHRYDLYCQVLSGKVKNTCFYEDNDLGSKYNISTLEYKNKPGDYRLTCSSTNVYLNNKDEYYNEGDEYFLPDDVFHTIKFYKDTNLLIYEGVTKNDYSNILLPVVNGVIINTFKIESWMFK